MTTAVTLDGYFELVDELRERRRALGWVAGQDRELLARLEDLYLLLPESDQDEVERQGARWWPRAT